MEVGVRAVLQVPDPGCLGNRERLEQERTLTPRAAGVHLDLLAVEAETTRHRGHDLATERLQILRCEQPLVLALMGEDPACDVAAVERPAYRRESGHAIVAGRALLVAEELQDAAEIGLHQPLTQGGDFAARHPDRDVLRPVAHVVGVPAHVVEHDRMAGEALECVAHGPRRHVAERHRAPPLQRLEAGVGRGRHHGAPHPERHDALVALDEPIRVERTRPASDSGDRDHLAGLGEADDHGRHARHAHLVAVHHPEGQDRGDPRVDGIAAVVERLERSQCCKLMAGADDVLMTTGNGHDGHGSLRSDWGRVGPAWAEYRQRLGPERAVLATGRRNAGTELAKCRICAEDGKRAGVPRERTSPGAAEKACSGRRRKGDPVRRCAPASDRRPALLARTRSHGLAPDPLCDCVSEIGAARANRLRKTASPRRRSPIRGRRGAARADRARTRSTAWRRRRRPAGCRAWR